jgi:hypothetical protein
MLQRFRTQKTGSRPGAVALAANRPYQEFLMNRTISLIALQSAVAAAILVAAPFASADPVQDPLVPAPATSQASRAEVRQAAIEARDARLASGVSVETLLDPTAAPFVSTLSRKQIHAEAAEATRLGVTSSHDGKRDITSEQLAQIRNAGLRAAQAMDVVAAVKQ